MPNSFDVGIEDDLPIGMPRYSKAASFVLDKFFATANDINFYFEDEGWEAFYERLLARLFPNLNIEKIFCLGGKSEVLKKSIRAGQLLRLYFDFRQRP